ncbi:hypothetical protein Cadr_000004859 [Camelus dromedarius]|uniref:Uncharacterized protein n=1 Tax=Camelus dromedarius TaxID=9838 RepID=A0A5N4EDC3_CAMDR|nr:hypothetical protein Cadr_000004859 [Camelus dromedarius]
MLFMEVAISHLRQELLTLYKAETKCTGQTPESHFFFLHLTVLGHWSSRRATAFVLLLALALTTIVSECRMCQTLSTGQYTHLDAESPTFM